jgi:hypothetical protein
MRGVVGRGCGLLVLLLGMVRGCDTVLLEGGSGRSVHPVKRVIMGETADTAKGWQGTFSLGLIVVDVGHFSTIRSSIVVVEAIVVGGCWRGRWWGLVLLRNKVKDVVVITIGIWGRRRIGLEKVLLEVVCGKGRNNWW